jgi:hypothetical protein
MKNSPIKKQKTSDMGMGEYEDYVQEQIVDYKEASAKSDAQKKLEGKRDVGLCEAINRYSSSCDKCLLYSGLAISFI